MKQVLCTNCGATVRRIPAGGRSYPIDLFRAVTLPADFGPAFVCERCGEMHLTVDEVARVESIAAAEQAGELRALVDELAARHRVTHKAVASACGLSAPYLSHVLAGRRLASVTVERLLRAYVAAPKEFARNLPRDGPAEDAHPADVVALGVLRKLGPPVSKSRAATEAGGRTDPGLGRQVARASWSRKKSTATKKRATGRNTKAKRAPRK